MTLLVVGAAFLVIGIGIGLTDSEADEQVAELTAEVAELKADAEDLEEDLDEAEIATELAEDDAVAAGSRRSDLRREAQRLRRRLDRLTAQTSDSPDDASGDSDSVSGFTFDDAQVRGDGIGDFEVRARVTNEGESAEFVDMQATLFSNGKVVADLDAFEDFEERQTRTVTFTGTDSFGAWDDVEFTVDFGF